MDKEIPKYVKVVMIDGSISHILVEVPWYPQVCKKCSVFGHNEKSCPNVVTEKKIWVPKKQLNNTVKVSSYGTGTSKSPNCNLIKTITDLLTQIDIGKMSVLETVKAVDEELDDLIEHSIDEIHDDIQDI
ncbi:hypothetical protein PTKIN_Ptkin13bG0030200 [Pterospermum kingtungense]